MDLLLIITLATGFPFSIASFFMIRKWARLREATRPIIRASRRADVLRGAA